MVRKEIKMETEMITITKKRYEQLFEAEKELRALHCAGVDNWEGYDDAMESLEED